MPTHRFELPLRAFALSFPETHEDLPWGHSAIKVRGKAFVFMSKDEPALSVSVKLPWSAEGALQFPFCEPTHYGLGRSGWVTASFAGGTKPPVEALRSWIEESYRAVAPKKLVKALDAAQAARGEVLRARAAKAERPTPRRKASAVRVARAKRKPARRPS